MKSPVCRCCPSPSSRISLRTLQLAIALVLGFSLIEWLTGRFSHSLSLVADSGHMFADAIALGLALWATWQERRRGVLGRSHRRIALFNSLSLLVMAGLVAWEALQHLHEPPSELLSLPTLAVAVLGLATNGTSTMLLYEDSQSNLTLRGAFLHAVADALGSVGAIAAAASAYIWGWHWVDIAVGLAIAIFIGVSAVSLLLQSLQPVSDRPPSGWHEVGRSDLSQLIQPQPSQKP